MGYIKIHQILHFIIIFPFKRQFPSVYNNHFQTPKVAAARRASLSAGSITSPGRSKATVRWFLRWFLGDVEKILKTRYILSFFLYQGFKYHVFYVFWDQFLIILETRTWVRSMGSMISIVWWSH
jgi:hypothetical protein